jgi:hypothetical protein
VWRTKQFTQPGYVKPVKAGSTESAEEYKKPEEETQ